MSEYYDWAAHLDRLIKDCADREATANLRANRKTDADPVDEQTAIEALPTIYRDTQFRSLLEACWAATLDSLHIAWEYEPQTFTLPSGVKYLPDFHLTEIGVWLEVKGPGIPRVEKAYELGKMLACNCPATTCTCRWPGGEMVIVGHPPAPARRRGGFLRWTSTRRFNSWMTSCSDCARVTWIEGPRLHRCPACGARYESSLYRAFENQYEFVRLPWLSGRATQPDTEAA